jgi:ribosomal protein S27E
LEEEKMQKVVLCPNCGLTVGEQIGGKLVLGLAGLLVTAK